MSFLNSFWLWGPLAAAGVAVPIIIHLISRYRSRKVMWAAMELLRRALVVRSKRMRLEDLILLLLRCLAMALIALAMGRLVLSPSASSAIGGGEGKAGVIIAIDGSFSMLHQGGEQTRFDLARKRVRDITATLSPGDPVSIILMGERPQIKLRNVAYDPERTEAVLKAMTATNESLNIEQCLEKIVMLAQEMKAPSRQCYIITDAQAVSWGQLSDGAKNSMKSLDNFARIFLAAVGPEKADNLGVTRLEVASGILRKGSTTRYVADVLNAGWQRQNAVTVRLLVDGIPVDQKTIDKIEPGKAATVPLFANFDRSGTFVVSAKVDVDALAVDNVRYAIADIRESVNVLCIDGDPSEEKLKGDTGYLAGALAPMGPGGGVNVKVVSPGSVDGTMLAGYDAIIMANVPELSRTQTLALGSYVRSGGGLMVFLGNKTNAGLSNRQFRDGEDRPLLPVDLGDFAGSASEQAGAAAGQKGWEIATEMPDTPLTRIFTSIPRQQWGDDIRFWRYVKATARKEARTLLRLSPGNDVLAAEQPFGRGRVVAFTSSADCDWTTLPKKPVYLMMVQQAVTWLSRRSFETAGRVAQPLAFELAAMPATPSLGVRDPAGLETQVRLTDRDGQKAVILDNAAVPGVYTVQYSDQAPPLKRVVNVDPNESAIAVLRGGALDSAMGDVPVRVVDAGADLQSIARQARMGRELWRTLLTLALIALLVEAGLARFFVWRMSRNVARTGRGYGRSGSDLIAGDVI
ncbi:MAG: VWA domain-containing protein [Planctomycetaceae bacterium]|nr:VWA domain-containing protein [Planctomycetaceae bacterium]